MAADLKTTVAASDRLIKALITILAVRDPTLLNDLEVVFQRAAAEGNPVGLAMPGVWKEINRELGIIKHLAEDEIEAELQADATPH